MRIALVTHRFVRGDGQGRVNLEIAAEALRRNWKVILVASDVSPELLQVTGAQWVRIDVDAWPTPPVRHHVFAVKSAYWLWRHRRDIDIVHANGFVSWANADTNAAHFVHSAWQQSAYRHRGAVPGLRRLYQDAYTALNTRLERFAYARCRVVVAVSEQVSQQLRAIGVAAETIRVIPNGVDTTEFHPRQAERSANGLPGGVVTGLFVGDLMTPRKNLDGVLRALVDCRDVHLAVVGEIRSSPYPRMARDLGLADRVHFLGFRRDVAQLMREVDFVACPSLYEPSGLVLFEGLASAVPVITARTVGSVEATHGDGVVVVPDPEDVDSLARAIRSLAESPQLRTRIGAAGRLRAASLDFRVMAGRYCDLFSALAATR